MSYLDWAKTVAVTSEIREVLIAKCYVAMGPTAQAFYARRQLEILRGMTPDEITEAFLLTA